MFKYIASFLSLILTTVILQTDTHASSCNPGCDLGYFCNTQVNPTPFCNTCNKPNDATFTGVGNDNDPDSCQWKVTCSPKNVMCGNIICGTWAPDDDYSTGYGSAVSANNGGCKYTNSNRIAYNSGYYRV